MLYAVSNPDPVHDDAARHPLEYYVPEKSSAPLWPFFVLWLDGLSIVFVFGFTFLFLDACQTNLNEAWINGGGGSAYRESAPCNEQWQKDHPRFAAFILSLPLECLELLLLPIWLVILYGYLFTGYTLPYLLLGWLVYRLWTQRRRPASRILFAIPLLLLMAMLPWLHECMLVIYD